MPPLPSWSIDPLSAPLGAGGTGWLSVLAAVGSLALLEAVLSADNAVALAGIVRAVEPPEMRRRVLNRGLLCAFVLRGLMILAAGWVIHFEPARIAGGLYLVWLALRHFQEELEEEGQPSTGPAPQQRSPLALMATIAGTDLAFSLDSVSASVAVSDNLLLVLVGGGIGVLMLRFLAGWVIQWMDRYVHLANAAYLTVLAVGLKMLALSLVPALVPPQGVVLVAIGGLFSWGFSQTRDEVSAVPQSAAIVRLPASSSGNGVCSTPTLTRANTSRL